MQTQIHAFKAVLRICLSIPDPGYQIQQQQQKWRAKKFVGLSSFVATNITKLKLYYCTETNLS